MKTESPWKRLGLTVAILTAYGLLHYVPLPILDLNALREVMQVDWARDFVRGSIFALGVIPFFSGFFLVELFSILTPWGRRFREGGLEGRRRLTGWAIGLSFVICMVQATSVVLVLEGVTTPGGLPLVPVLGWASRIVGIATLTAASAAAFAMCNLITVRGFGNGFCLLVVFDFLSSLAAGWDSWSSSYEPATNLALYLMALLVVVSVFTYFQKNQASYEVMANGRRTGLMLLPSFPQGLVPVVWAYALLEASSAIASLLGRDADTFVPTAMQYLASVAVAVSLLSLVTVHFFSTRKRLEHNVPGVMLPEDFDGLLKRRLYLTTATLTVAVVAYTALEIYGFGAYYLPGFLEIAMVTTVGLDLVDEWRFRQRHAGAERLIELDNVQLAIHVRGVLQERGIACLVQAYHARSLFFFFRPLYKMNVLVPADRLAEARERLAELDARIV